jgi:lon-related putative ATP-dependent protease
LTLVNIARERDREPFNPRRNGGMMEAPERAHMPVTGDSTRLPPERLCRRCDPAQFTFATTAEIEDGVGTFAQERARNAIEFGLGIGHEGYNLFVLGPAGAGKQTLLREILAREAARAPAPPDWCYVHNFDAPHEPRALRLPAGRGVVFRSDMRRLVDDLLASVPQAFESDEYRAHREQLEAEFNERQQKAFAALAETSGAKDIALLRTPTGFTLAPVRNGEVLSPDEFSALPDEERKRISDTIESLQGQLEQLMRDALRWRKEQRERVRELNREVAKYTVGAPIDELEQRYADLPDVLAYLAAVEKDLVENVDDFRRGREPQATIAGLGESQSPPFRRYEVNLLLEHREGEGAPVVFEDHPTYQNIVGRVEHTPQLGALVTDFTLIKAGALHRANGGYLLLDAQKVLMQPYAWEGLKRALRTRRIRIESLGQIYSLVSTISLEPEPIPLDVKIVFFGERLWYWLLTAYDPDFAELFKVAADFDDDVPRTDDSQQSLARLIATVAHRGALPPFDRAAVARVIEERARAAEDAEKLSTHMQALVDLLTQSAHAARLAGAATVGAEHVDAAIEAGRRRGGRLREKLQEAILRGTVLIDTEGERIGQVNGLSVFALGRDEFATPSRITATTRLGDGEVIDVQREVEMSGPIHSKGVLILASFLATRFSGNRPHSLRASLAVEQTYGAVEGDSASAAELCALLSSLAGVPIRQSFAITGSVNQHGELQAIGAVNQKIEGFFDICRARGLTGSQAVVIPESNVKNLMLRADVVDAVAGGRFHVHAARTIDDVIGLVTGIPAGERTSVGGWPEGSLNQRVAARLAELARLRQVQAAAAAPRLTARSRKPRG